MVEIPQNTVGQNDLADWFETKRQLGLLKAKEGMLRSRIAKAYFPNPVEGTNKHTLPDGYILKLTHVINRDVDEAVLAAKKDEFLARNIPVAHIVVYKPSLSKSVYNTLTDEDKVFFDNALISKPGSPTLEIVPPAKPRGERGEAADADNSN